LRVEYFSILADEFRREGWPVTFGQTNPPSPPEPPPKVVRTELEVQDVSRDYAMALIRHILPEVEEFGRRFGPPLDGPVREEDIVMGESSVRMLRGRIWVTLRLNSGYQAHYWAGRVMRVNTDDIHLYPAAREEYGRLDTEENRDPIRVSPTEAVEKVRRVVVDRFGLSGKPLYLDTNPTFTHAPRSGAASGVRRYVFYWAKPETPDERDERIDRRILPDVSVYAEVDAVSGVIKMLSLMHPSLYRPDPEIGVPRNPAPN
jgi:hypothetical protein